MRLQIYIHTTQHTSKQSMLEFSGGLGETDLGEVVALDEVSCDVSGGSTVHRRGDVVPGHAGLLGAIVTIC